MTEANQPVLAIFGPTGSGKSAVAEAVAGGIPAEIVSADSMQVYRGLAILTNQPARPTRLVAIWELDYEASVGEYAKLAQHAVDEALTEGIIPLVVGGTGLYLRAALVDLDLPPAPSLGARPRFEGPNERTPCWSSATRARPRPSTRTTAGASFVRLSWPLRARAWHDRPAASGHARRVIRPSSSASTFRGKSSPRASKPVREPCSSMGWRRKRRGLPPVHSRAPLHR